MAKKALLMILDGWGIGSHGKGDVIFQTPTPFMDSLNAKYPHSEFSPAVKTLVCPMARWVTQKWDTSISVPDVSFIRTS